MAAMPSWDVKAELREWGVFMKTAPYAALVMALVVGTIVWWVSQTIDSAHIKAVEAEYSLCEEKSGELKSTNQYMGYSNATLKAQVLPLVRSLSEQAAQFALQEAAITTHWQKQSHDAKTDEDRYMVSLQMDHAEEQLFTSETQAFDTQYKAQAILLNEALLSRFSASALSDLQKRGAPYISLTTHGAFVQSRFQDVANQLEFLNEALPEQAPRPLYSFLYINDIGLAFFLGIVVGLGLAFLIALWRTRRIGTSSRLIIPSS